MKIVVSLLTSENIAFLHQVQEVLSQISEKCDPKFLACPSWSSRRSLSQEFICSVQGAAKDLKFLEDFAATPLHFAAARGLPILVGLLLDNGHDVQLQDKVDYNHTFANFVLIFASQHGNYFS